MVSTTDFLKAKARRIRFLIVSMIGAGNRGHYGGSFSIADIVAVLYFHTMRHDPKNPKDENRDRFVLSKGHGACAQYAALAEWGYFPLEALGRFRQVGSSLQGHPDMLKTPGVEANTGSLGQGLSIAVGMALAGKLDRRDYRVYCIVGDGEVAEGQIWEAAMAAAHYKLDNLIAILDRNRLQASGTVAERMDSSPLADKWKAFGWQVMEIDGHDVDQIAESLEQSRAIRAKPAMIIAHTVKGKGLPVIEENLAFHNAAMDADQFRQALAELGGKES